MKPVYFAVMALAGLSSLAAAPARAASLSNYQTSVAGPVALNNVIGGTQSQNDTKLAHLTLARGNYFVRARLLLFVTTGQNPGQGVDCHFEQSSNGGIVSGQPNNIGTVAGSVSEITVTIGQFLTSSNSNNTFTLACSGPFRSAVSNVSAQNVFMTAVPLVGAVVTQ